MRRKVTPLHPRETESPHRSAIIFVCVEGTSMEAERVNQVAASLADLKQRAAELRRYL